MKKAGGREERHNINTQMCSRRPDACAVSTQQGELPVLLLHFHCSQSRQGCAHSDGNQRSWRVVAHGNHSYERTEHADGNNRPSMHACKN